MEPGQCAAGDGDEHEREQRTGEHRAGAVEGELRDRRVLQRRSREEHADRQQPDRADLHKGRQVVARGEQHPHREHRGEEAVDDQGDHQGLRGQREDAGQAGLLDPPTADDRQEQQRDTDHGGLDDPAGPQRAQVEPHEQRDGDRHGDAEGAPRGCRQRVDDDEGKHREQDDHDREDRQQGGRATHRADLFPYHLAQALAVAAHGEEQDHHVLDPSGEDHTGDDPDGARQVAHLGRQHRTDQRASPGDRREVVAQQDAAVCGLVVDAVVQAFGWGGSAVIDL